MNGDQRNKPTKTGPSGGHEGERPGGGPFSSGFGTGQKRVVGPLIGCPLILFMIVFILFLTIVAFILSLFGGRKAAELIMGRIATMRAASGGFPPAAGDPDVIDVEGEVIDPPKRDNE